MKIAWIQRFRRRGVALILALFTTAILITLSLAFLALAIGESRTSRGASQEKAVLEAANYGIEYTLNYMGLGNYTPLGQPPVTTWERYVSSSGFGFYNVLRRQPQARPHVIPNLGIVIEDVTDDPTLVRFEPSVELKPALRKLRLVKTNAPGNGPPPSAALALGNELAFTFEVAIVPVLPSSRVTSYRLISTARLFRQASDGQVAFDVPLATRVVEAQVLPDSAASYLHFLANARGLVGQGIAKYDVRKFDNTDVADYAMIPGNFTENGPMRVDGLDPAIKGQGAAATEWLNNSGNVRFSPNAKDKNSGGNVTFQDRLTINQKENKYDTAGGLDDTNSGFFTGGFTTQKPRLGLPQLDLVNITNVSQYVPNPNPAGQRAGYYTVPTSEIAAAPRCAGPGGDPFYERYEPQEVNGQVLMVPIAYDYRPRFPKVEVTLDGNKVTVQKRNTLTNQVMGPTETFEVDKLAGGVIMVEGGNAVVKSVQPFQGQLSVVAGEHPGRQANAPADQIYSDASSELFAYEKKRWDAARAEGGTLDPSGYLTPPYTVAQLRAAKNAGIITASVPNLADDRALWPNPPANVEREGNLVIADDITSTRDRGTTLGLFAQNFLLINDETPEANGKRLVVDAVLMSKERNVSLDWDNTARMPLDNWKKMTSPNFNGILEMRGSVIGEFVDIEGDTQGRGYVVQDFAFNPNLRNTRPPLCPAWDFSILPGGFSFSITHYTDKGALATDRAL